MKFSCDTTAVFLDKNGITVPYSAVFDGIVRGIEVFATKNGKSLSKEDREDIMMDAFVKAVKYSYSYDSTLSSPETWGSRIARSCAVETAMRITNSGTVSISTLERVDKEGNVYYPDYIESFRSDETMADREYETHETLSQIQEAQDSLNETYREVLDLNLQGLKPRDIAEIKGCTPNAVSSILCRARKQIKGKLDQ